MRVIVCIDEESFLNEINKDFSYDICIIGYIVIIDDMQQLKSYVKVVCFVIDYLYIMFNIVLYNMCEVFIGSGVDVCFSKLFNYCKLCEILVVFYCFDYLVYNIEQGDEKFLLFKVLVVDDNDVNLKFICIFFEEKIELIDIVYNGF